MKTLYIDETENGEYFIIAGLLANSTQDVELAYKRFKNRIKGERIAPKYKVKVFTEFKSIWLDNDYQKIKRKMLEEIRSLNGNIFYAKYEKRGRVFNQALKESVYITMLSSIANILEEETKIIFDGFNKTDFEERIISAISPSPLVFDICPADSHTEPGLQFADNICSVIRLHLSKDKRDLHYEMIDYMVTEI